jgi:hypothetical protein
MTTSANNTTIMPSFITDVSGGQWSITPSPTALAQVCHNGVVDTSTSNVMMLLYENNIVYHENTAGNFYGFQNSTWVQTAGDPRKVTSAESTDGTTVTTVGPTIIDASLETWTLTASSSGQIACNGTIDGTTNHVTLLLYKNRRIYQQNNGGGWWYKAKSSDPWTVASDPRVTTTPTSTTTSAAPPQAAAAGYNTMTFGDDFSVQSIQYLNGDNGAPSPVGIPKWYNDAGAGANHTQVFISNNVLHFVGAANNSGSQGQLSTIVYHSTNVPAISTISSHQVSTGNGVVFVYGYFEAAMAFNWPGSGGGFPAFWAAAADGNGDPRPGNEIDFMEYGSGGLGCTVWEHQTNGGPDDGQNITSSGPSGGAGTYHIYGCLWRGPVNGATGTIDFYVDNVHVGHTVVTGPGTPFTACVAPFVAGLHGDSVILGTGPGWNMTVDWVRIWQ